MSSSARQVKRRCCFCSVSSTRHWCSSSESSANRAIEARRENSHVRICMSPVMGHEKTSNASSERRNFLGKVV